MRPTIKAVESEWQVNGMLVDLHERFAQKSNYFMCPNIDSASTGVQATDTVTVSSPKPGAWVVEHAYR